MPSQFPSPTLCFIARVDGAVEFATCAGTTWLTRARRQRVAQLVREIGTDDLVEIRASIDEQRVVVLRLHNGEDQAAAFLIMVTPTVPAAEDPTLRLTPRQRAVAEYAAAGATAREIAGALSLTHDTVRDHLKEIYRRLGIASRVELALLLRTQV